MKILLVISQERDQPQALEYSLNTMGERGGELTAAYIVDTRFSSRFESQLMESFVADKPGQDLSEALNREYRQRGYKFLQSIEKRCAALKIPFRQEIRVGEYFETLKDLAAEITPDQLVVSERRHSFWKNLFGRTDRKRLESVLSLPIKSF